MPPSYRAGQQFYDAAVDALDRQGQAGDLTLKLDTYLERWVTGIETGAEGRGLGGVDGRPSAPRAVAGSGSPGGGGTSGPTPNHPRGAAGWHRRGAQGGRARGTGPPPPGEPRAHHPRQPLP